MWRCENVRIGQSAGCSEPGFMGLMGFLRMGLLAFYLKYVS